MTPKHQTPRDPQLYDYAAARVACEEADAALAARTAKTARQRLRIMRAAALAGALPATVDPDAAATVAHLSDRLAGRRRVAERPWEPAAARARRRSTPRRWRSSGARTTTPTRTSAASVVEAVAGGAWRAALGDSTAPGTPRPRGPRPPPSRRRAAAGRRRRGHLRPRRRQPGPGRRALRRAAAAAAAPRGRRPPAARQDRRAGRRHGRRGPARRRARARAALCRAEAAVPERVDATLPEAAAPPPAEAPGPAPAPLARGTQVRYKDGTLGSVAKCHHDDFPPYYDVALAGGRVVQCERGSLEVIDRRAAVEAKLRRRAPKEIRPALGAETVAAAGEALDALAEHGRGRGAGAAGPQRAGDRRGAQRREPRHGAPGPRRPARAARLRRPDGGGRRAVDARRAGRAASAPATTPRRRWILAGSKAPCGPSTGTSTSRAPRGRGRRAMVRPGRAREIIFDDGEAVPVEDCGCCCGATRRCRA